MSSSIVIHLIFILITMIISALKTFLPKSWKLFLLAYLWVYATAREAESHKFPVPESFYSRAPHCKSCKCTSVWWAAECLPGCPFNTKDTACKWEEWILAFRRKLFSNLHSDRNALSNSLYLIRWWRHIRQMSISFDQIYASPRIACQVNLLKSSYGW